MSSKVTGAIWHLRIDQSLTRIAIGNAWASDGRIRHFWVASLYLDFYWYRKHVPAYCLALPLRNIATQAGTDYDLRIEY